MIKNLKLGQYSTVGSNFVYLSILNFVNIILPFLSFPYLVMTLGIEMFGLLAFASSIITYFQIITDYGFNLTATQQISAHRDNKEKIDEIVSSVFVIKFSLLIISGIVLFILVNFVAKLEEHKSIYLLSFIWVVGQCLSPIWFFQSIEKMKIVTILNVVGKFTFTALIFILVKNKSDYYIVPLVNGISFLLMGFVSLGILIFQYKVRFFIPKQETLVYYLKNGWHIFLSNISVTLYTTFILTSLGFFASNIVVGYYSIADKIIQVIRSLLSPVSQALFPFLAAQKTGNKEKVLRINKKILIYGSLIMIPCCLGLFFLSDWIIFLVTKKVSLESSRVLKILSPIPFLIVLANVFALFTMIVFNRNKEYGRIIVSAGLVSIPLSFLLIPTFQNIGAALTVLMIELYVTFRYVYYVQKSDLKLL